jgi:uncharacterized protein YbjT (DUF2867 family)
MMKACVAGATGETGRRIVKELLSRHIPVRAMARHPETAQEILGSDVEIVAADLTDPNSLKAAISGCTVLLCATGARPSWDPTGPYSVDLVGTQRLVDLAKAEGIQHFVLVSSLCVSQFFHPLNLFWLILVWKKQAEDYLRRSGLTYTIVRPGGLKNEEDPNSSIIMASADSLFEGSIPRTQVAQVCVEALFLPAAQNKIVEIISKPDTPSLPLATLFAGVESL